MSIPSITRIRQLRDDIKQDIKNVDSLSFKDQTFGSEKEYTYKGLIANVETLLTDLSTLTKNENQFIKFSTYQERNSLSNILQNIKSFIHTPGNLYAQVDELKVNLRSFNIRYFEDRFIEFNKEMEEVTIIKINLQEDKFEIQKEIDEIKKKAKEIINKQEESKEKLMILDAEIKDLQKKKEGLEEEIILLESKNEEIEKLKKSSTDFNETIKTSFNEATSNEKVIKNFATNIQKSEDRLTNLLVKMDDNEEQLKNYAQERESLLIDAEKMLDSARQALNYSTAQGISAAFDTQHTNSKGFLKVGIWLFMALIFMGFIIGISCWILSGQSIETNVLIGRILMIPILSIGLYFCTSQYKKQKTIIEDYAYKTVIAKAIVGFSEQIKKNENENTDEYVTYMKTALAEIHQDPLRKRSNNYSKSSSSNEVDPHNMLEVFQKFADIFKSKA
ncbi:hypothetical protein D1632_10230 [Chryseobacterium nematophagum]|uniref:Uncharacterized protein n=1 Tax=Chryseobacterium nematophagum TaxID=2305228 RepID=A0A3M7LEL8_9FLAO|nr:hypothetical protein [Chryseobacterium nematophagum]RMZ59966.1 hypothetical protein D1632_10230 [Chryseobacterium nematophagum]